MGDNIPQAPGTPTVATQPLPTPFDDTRTSPDTFGYGAGQAAQQEGEEKARVSAEYTIKANAVAEEAAFSRAQQAYNDIIANPKSGYLSLKGSDALAQGDAAQQSFRDAIGKIKASLTPDQQRLIGYRLDVHVLQPGLALAETHERREHDTIAEAAFHGSEMGTTEQIAQLASDPKSTPKDLSDKLNLLIENARNRAVYKYGKDAPADAIRTEALPVLQGAAVKAMSEALATGDPQHASNVLLQVGPYLGAHAKLYTGAVNKLIDTHAVALAGEKILLGATTSIVLPDGTQVGRLDAGRIGAGIAALNPGDRLTADTVKYVAQNQTRMNEVWKQTIAQQVDLAKQEGDPAKVGQFDMEKVDKVRREWLHDHDVGALNALAALADRRDRRDTRDDSNDVKSYVEAQITAQENREKLVKQSPEEFQHQLLKGFDFEGKPLDAKLLGPHIDKLVSVYRQARNDAGAAALGGLKVEDIVHASIARAADDDPDKIKDLRGSFYSALVEKAKLYVASHKATTNPEDIGKYVDRELAKGKILGGGPFGYFDSKMRRIEAQTRAAAYTGKVFEPETPEGGDSEMLGKSVEVEREAPPNSTATQAPAAPSRPAAAPPAGRIWMRKGNAWGSVPESQRDTALKQGYSLE